ncbi:hypothetical protein CC86DRAFT_136931 [Ophiobolus disseminans]|uniref:Uncharacterized protein n=1 Tax=Ophiobolus disseminans TaxID=1469910 RepID=A0A6A7ADC8_9PLEO|nr:hypothetical protein CC86DRAFT_136931 [Ophiobolus disseminans]
MRISTIALAVLSPAAVICSVIEKRQVTPTPAPATPTAVVPTPTPAVSAVPDPQAVRFNFVGCDTAQRKAINDAWSHLRTIGKAVNFDIDWESQAAIDFLGGKNSAAYQYKINNLVRNLHTWEAGGTIFAWKMDMHCNDYARNTANVNCPDGTKKPDYDKCSSRCWAYSYVNGQVVWRYAARAYTNTETYGHVYVGKQNFCPGFFALRTCPDLLAENMKKYPEGNINRLDLNKYTCQTWIAIHELMHIDANVGRSAGGVDYKHITDLRIKVRNNEGKIVTQLAYGPIFTKALAKWTVNTGSYVIRNADSIALYCLATWLTSSLGAYPKYPEVRNIDRPVAAPWLLAGGIYNYDGIVYLNRDAAVLAADLNVQPNEIESFSGSSPLGCSDADDSTGTNLCVDDVHNPAIDLSGPKLPKPNDFNCGSAGSLACCANGSCACHCGESGCAAEDPVCCANGSCAPLPKKMMPRFGRMQRN